jgi:uncharacterized membrane protein YuzA (DUF378 family)
MLVRDEESITQARPAAWRRQMEMPTLDWPGQKTRWVFLLLTWTFTYLVLVTARNVLPPVAEGKSTSWTTYLMFIVGLAGALCVMCFSCYFTVVMFKAQVKADEIGFHFRNVRSDYTTLHWNDIARATQILGGMDRWQFHYVLLIVRKDGRRHRVNAIPYLFKRHSIFIQQWIDYINFKSGGEELIGLPRRQDTRHLGQFSDFQSFKEAVKDEFLR